MRPTKKRNVSINIQAHVQCCWTEQSSDESGNFHGNQALAHEKDQHS